MPYADPVRAREYRREYRERLKTDPALRAANAAHQRKWRHSRPEWVRASNKRAAERLRTNPRGRAGYLLSRAKQRAREIGVELDLTAGWVFERITAKCVVSGLEFDLTTRRRSPLAPSIDRIDSAGGYTKDNCRLVVLALNTAFSDWGQEEFLKVALAYAAFQINARP